MRQSTAPDVGLKTGPSLCEGATSRALVSQRNQVRHISGRQRRPKEPRLLQGLWPLYCHEEECRGRHMRNHQQDLQRHQSSNRAYRRTM